MSPQRRAALVSVFAELTDDTRIAATIRLPDLISAIAMKQMR